MPTKRSDKAEVPTTSGRSVMTVTLTVTAVPHTLEVEPRVSLLDALRELIGLTGPKKGCNQGACGACTILVDGERILSCLALAVQHNGRTLTTLEGLMAEDELHQLQEALIEHAGFQCGYCTPGQICSAVGMLREFEAAAAQPIEVMQYSMASYGAQFREVRVNEVTGEVRVARWVGSFDCGRILNPKTATSQFRGGIIMGIGMALSEETVVDERSGRIVNRSLAEYHVPVNLDVPDIDVRRRRLYAAR